MNYLAAGLPVVSTSVGAEGIAYERGKNLLIADTPQEFCRSIEALTGDLTLYNEIRREALATIKREYSWSRQLQPLRALLGLKS